jgi:HAMP domain-containing protein
VAGVTALLLTAAGGTAAAQQEPEEPAVHEELERMTREMHRLRAEIAALQARPSAPVIEAGRIEALEAEVARLQAELKRLGEQVKQTEGGLEGLSREDERRIALTVYGTLDWERYGGRTSVFDGHLFELVLSGRPHKRLSFIAQVEYERAASVGGERGGEVVLEQAYPTLAFSSLFNLRAGVFLMPFGNVGIDHFPTSREVVSRPLVAEVIAPQDWTDNGVGLSGRRLFASTWLVSYEAWVCAGLGAGIDASGLREARQPFGVDNNGNKALAARAAVNRASRLELGLSGYAGKYDDADRLWLRGFAVDALALLGPFKVTGEYDILTAARTAGPDARYRGYYLRAVYEFGSSALVKTPFGKDFVEPKLSLVAQWDSVAIDGDEAGVLERNRERRQTYGLNYRPAGQWVLKLAYERNSTSARPLVRGDADGWTGAVAFVF